MVARELALIKVKATPATRSEIMQVVDIFRAKIVDVAADSVVVEVTGDENKLESLLRLLDEFGIRELSRTGRIAMTRGVAGDHHDTNKIVARSSRPKKSDVTNW
jgi:acetolactate synthase-1/3 small subunit